MQDGQWRNTKKRFRLTQGRWALLSLLFLCVLPILVGTALYVWQWRPTRTANYGQLVLPPRLMPEDFFSPAMRGRWLLVLAGDGACAKECLAWVRSVRAIQISLSKEMGRIRRVLLVPGAIPLASAPAPSERSALDLWMLQQEQKDLLVLPGRPHWQAVLGVTGVKLPYQLYLIDPMGNVMMRYPADANPKGIRADLERLLKYSWTG